MEQYSQKYMETHCIDVFFSFGRYPVHVLTAGSTIPEALNDILRNRTLQEEIERNELGDARLEVATNDAYIQELIDRHRAVVEEYRRLAQLNGNNAVANEPYTTPEAEQISAHFRHYAEQGFYSYDCSELREDGTAVYKLMAWPKELKEVKFDLPQFSPGQFKVDNNSTNPLPYSFTM